MKKVILILLCAVFLIGLAQAEIQFWQTQKELGNGTLQNFMSLQYSKQNFQVSFTSDNFFCVHFGIFCNPVSLTYQVGDYVKGANPYEFYLWYNLYVQKWNIDNPNLLIDNCTFIVNNYKKALNNVTTILDLTLDGTSDDILNQQFFVQLQDGDGISAYQTCNFQNRSYENVDLELIPASMEAVTPSWECKSCQFYQYTLYNRNVVKAQNITSNSITTLNYVKNLLSINFEAWLMFFWASLILIVFMAISFIFLAMFWFYKYLKGVVK